jgi:hypothetical protein
MGVNLIPKLDNFRISRDDFRSKEEGGDGSVNLKCVEKGKHRVLRFDLHVINIGDKDLVIGNPKDRPDIFEPSIVFSTGFQFREKFFVYTLKNDDSSLKISGYKIPFCFEDEDKYTCENQGIGKESKEDVYGGELPCQFVVIDDVPDGEYTLEATLNAPSVNAVKTGKGKVLFEEDNYDDNTVSVRLQIKGNDVTEISQTKDPKEYGK